MLAVVFLVPYPSGAQEYAKWHPGHYALYVDNSVLTADRVPAAAQAFERLVASLPDEIIGLQGGAYWAQLEPEKDRFDLSLIELQLRICARHHKRFFCTVSEKRWGDWISPAPEYLRTDPAYHGGVIRFRNSRGSQARLWEPAILERFNKLIAALGRRFDKEPYFEGIEFVETAADVDPAEANTTPTDYINALKCRLRAAKQAFPTTVVLQEINWLPGNDREQMADFFRFCRAAGVGIGGPDLIPDRQRAPQRPRIPAYEFFPQYAGQLPLASDVQEPQYLGHVGNKILGTLTPEGIYEMGVNTLKLDYFFWAVCDGKNQNFTFSHDVLPYLKRVRRSPKHNGEQGDSEGTKRARD